MFTINKPGSAPRHAGRIRRHFAIGAIAGLGTAALVLGPGTAAFASGGSHTQSVTQTLHGSQSYTDVNPCNGDTMDFTAASNLISHETYFPASDEMWATFTEEDNFTAVDEGTGVLYTGHSTAWGNFNLNQQNANQTFTFSAHATGSNGSTFSGREVAHVTLLPDGTVSVSFDKLSLTCP